MNKEAIWHVLMVLNIVALLALGVAGINYWMERKILAYHEQVIKPLLRPMPPTGK